MKGSERRAFLFSFHPDERSGEGSLSGSPRSEKKVERAYLAEAPEALRTGAPVEAPWTKAFSGLIRHGR